MADKKIPADIRNWVSKQVENFQDSEGDMNSVFLSSVTGEVSEGSGYVIRLNISPMIKAKGDKTPTPSDRVIIEFAVGDGSRAAPCAIHNGSAKQLGGGWDDSEEFKSALDLLAQAQYDGKRLRIKGQYRTYKNKRLFIVDTIEKDEDSKKSKLSDRQFNTFIRKCNKANLTPLEIMTQTLWEKFFAPEYIKEGSITFLPFPLRETRIDSHWNHHFSWRG